MKKANVHVDGSVQTGKQVSVAPDGETFKLPNESDHLAENEKLAKIVDEQRRMGREIVVVMGVGFVGSVMAGVDAVIFAVRHEQYRDLKADEVVEKIGKPAAIIDCFGILPDEQIKRYFELGCEVKGLGRGHIQRIKEAVREGIAGADHAKRKEPRQTGFE